MTSLPDSVLALVEMTPVEDLMLALLRQKLPDIPVNSLIADDQEFPLVVLRNTGAWGEWEGDDRFLDAGSVVIHAYCEGIDGDSDAALLSEAVRVCIRDSVNVTVEGYGHLVSQEVVQRARRVTDWATSTGPVQYADLPTGVWRYESTFKVVMRKPANKPYPQSP